VITLYTAGPWADREIVKEIANKFRDAGYHVNSRWLDVSTETPDGMTSADYYRMQAHNDLEDVLRADVLIYCNTGTLSEGKATELGVAMGTMKPIVVIGNRERNIFLNFDFPFFDTAELAIEWMRSEEMKATLAAGIEQSVTLQ